MSEEIVTKILSSQEILSVKNKKIPLVSEKRNSVYNLGEFLKTAKPEPSRFGSRYIFVK